MNVRAECNLPPELRLQMDLLSGTPAFVQYNRAVEYYDFNCYDAAEREFKGALELMSAPNPTTREATLRGLAADGLALARAGQLLKKGEKNAAIEKLMEVAERIESPMKLRGILALVPLLEDQSPHWSAIERDLDVLAGRGYWQAEKVIMQRLVAAGQAAAAAVRLEKRLAAAQTMQDAFAAEMLLADAWRAAGRTLEAWLLVRSMERDAGTDLVDFELRVEFIRIADGVAAVRAAAGDADAKRAKAIYDVALSEVNPQ
jgi:hypothetical protein